MRSPRSTGAALRAAARAAAVVLAIGFVSSLTACAAPVRTVAVPPAEVYVETGRSVLSGDGPSAAARLVLARADLADLWAEDPAAAIVALDALARAADTRDRLYGLSELCLAHAQAHGDRTYALGAAVYAYLFLFGAADAPPPGPFDPRFRIAGDLYERGLAEAFRDPADGRLRFVAGTRALPVGALDVTVDGGRTAAEGLDDLRWAGELAVVGLRSRVRAPGLGAQLVAGRSTPPDDAQTADGPGRVAPRLDAPATALLDVHGELADLGAQPLRATLVVRAPDEAREALVRGRSVPLACDVTAPVAHSLTDSDIWRFELAGFLAKDTMRFRNGLFFRRPYERGRIPLVLVHGTASSPARWAELVNELDADPVIAERYQVWLFLYSTGVPVLVSAQSLRASLEATLAELDPEGTDDALRHIVVAGHSQGGLLTRLTATASGDRFWRNVSAAPFESLELDAAERARLRELLFFEPLPCVERVVFVATPHAGSFVAGNLVGKLGSMLVSLPGALVQGTADAVSRNVALLRGDRVGALPTAVDNMQPDSDFVRALADLPIDPRVHVHSIVAVDGDGPPEEGDDGVVSYASAHLPSAESEVVVRCVHSCQGHPGAILEMRRILHQHLAGLPAPAR